MRYINLLDVSHITNQTNPLNDDVTVLTTVEGYTVMVPRPVMVGLATFVHIAYGGCAEKTVLTYDGFQFSIPGPIDYQTFLSLRGFYKYLTDAGLERMSKVFIRDYSKIEHFYRRKQERVPVEIDGFQTRMVVKPHTPKLIECFLDIEQRSNRTDLLSQHNHELYEVVQPTEPLDANWWGQTHSV